MQGFHLVVSFLCNKLQTKAVSVSNMVQVKHVNKCRAAAVFNSLDVVMCYSDCTWQILQLKT